MAEQIAIRLSLRQGLALFAFLLLPFSAYPQATLTGAVQFSTNSSGAFNHFQNGGGQYWVTAGDDIGYGLWLALDANAVSPVNGPSDADAGISIPLVAGRSYKYYIFGQPGLTNAGPFSYSGLNLFFDGNNSTPGISAYGALNSLTFLPDQGTTLTWQGAYVAGSAATLRSVDGVVVVLTRLQLEPTGRGSRRRVPPFSFSPG